jgi:hypothetical protein
VNFILLIIVIALLIIACLLGIKILFLILKFCLGICLRLVYAISSLLSAAGTLGTLYVAYLAYKKVPEWMAQKHYDIAYGIIEKSIYTDLRALRPLSYSIQSINQILNAFNKTISSGTVGTEISEEDILEIDNAALLFQQKSEVIIEQLNAVKRTNYELTKDADEVIYLLIKSRLNNFNICDDLYELNDKLSFVYTGDVDQKNECNKKITDLQNSAKGNNASIIKMINDIKNGNKAISDFITPKKQTHP